MNLLEELRTLDRRQPGNWPWPIKVATLLVVFIVIQAAAYFLVWQGQADQIEQGRNDVAKQKETFLEKKKLAVNLEGASGMLAGPDAIQDGFWQMQCMAQFSSRIGGGTNEVHRNMIGERALGLPAEARADKDLPWRDIPKS